MIQDYERIPNELIFCISSSLGPPCTGVLLNVIAKGMFIIQNFPERKTKALNTNGNSLFLGLKLLDLK